jgi:UDP-N-acetylglucosamine acyltransferase
VRLGRDNRLYPAVCIGFDAQVLGDADGAAASGVAIGDDNVFREGVTVHAATHSDAATRIGDHNYFMANSHVGHDCQVGSGCVFANGTLLGGHVHAYDRVVTGGNSAVHQHCQIGRGAMLSGAAAISRDLPPFFMATGINLVGSINLTGMRRSGMSRAEIEEVRWVYRLLYRQGLTPWAARTALAQRNGSPLVTEYLDFIAHSRRGLCPGRPDARRRK